MHPSVTLPPSHSLASAVSTKYSILDAVQVDMERFLECLPPDAEYLILETTKCLMIRSQTMSHEAKAKLANTLSVVLNARLEVGAPDRCQRVNLYIISADWTFVVCNVDFSDPSTPS